MDLRIRGVLRGQLSHLGVPTRWSSRLSAPGSASKDFSIADS